MLMLVRWCSDGAVIDGCEVSKGGQGWWVVEMVAKRMYPDERRVAWYWKLLGGQREA